MKLFSSRLSLFWATAWDPLNQKKTFLTYVNMGKKPHSTLTEWPNPLVQNKLPPDHWEVNPFLNLINKINHLEVSEYADIHYLHSPTSSIAKLAQTKLRITPADRVHSFIRLSSLWTSARNAPIQKKNFLPQI